MQLILVSGDLEHNYSLLVIGTYKGRVINIALTNIYILVSPAGLECMVYVYVCVCAHTCAVHAPLINSYTFLFYFWFYFWLFS